MLSRISKASLRIALILTIFNLTSGHWITLQAIAWTKMITAYSKHSTFKEAIADTFDGHHPCDLCKEIEKGKEAEKKQELAQVIIKKDFFCEQYSLVAFIYPDQYRYPPASNLDLNSLSKRPVIPPPRNLPV